MAWTMIQQACRKRWAFADFSCRAKSKYAGSGGTLQLYSCRAKSKSNGNGGLWHLHSCQKKATLWQRKRRIYQK